MTSTETVEYRQHRHIGVYGICVVNGHLLLIRKARGPYIGLWDLPGGGIEFGEEPIVALRREFIEETGITIDRPTLIDAVSNRVRYVAGDGVPEELHHLGLIYTIEAPQDGDELPAIRSSPDGEDSTGAIWTRLDTLDDTTLTPFARLARMY